MIRPIHSDFLFYLQQKDQALIDLYVDLRGFILKLHGDSNELLYQTHALTSVYTISSRLSDGYCHIPIYSKHLNLGFNKGTLLKDQHGLLDGTGKWIRHIKINEPADYRIPRVIDLVMEAREFAVNGMDKPTKDVGLSISKIKQQE